MNYPSHTDLVTLWMLTYFKNESCAVFFDPLGDGDRVREIAMICGLSCRDDAMNIVNSDVYVCPIDEDRLSSFVNNLDQAVYGYVMGWNGNEFVTHN